MGGKRRHAASAAGGTKGKAQPFMEDEDNSSEQHKLSYNEIGDNDTDACTFSGSFPHIIGKLKKDQSCNNEPRFNWTVKVTQK